MCAASPTTRTVADRGAGDSDRRRRRYELAERLWSVSNLKRVRMCGRRRVSADGLVPVHHGEGLPAYLSNVQRCGAVWQCPPCSAKIRQHRANEASAAIEGHMAAGGSAYFVTLTIPHHQGQALDELVGIVNASWRSLLSGEAYQTLRSGFDLIGNIRALEVTHGVNGWHPHLHVVVLSDDPGEVDQAEALEGWFFPRWRSLCLSAGLEAPLRGVGVDVQQVNRGADVGQYLGKVVDDQGTYRKIGLELTRHDLKVGRRAGRTPFQLLADMIDEDTGELRPAEAALWAEYERAMVGVNSVRWSRGLRSTLEDRGIELGELLDDQAVVDAEVGAPVVCVLDADQFRRLSHRRGGFASVLEGCEASGRAGVELALRLLGFPSHTLDPPDRQ